MPILRLQGPDNSSLAYSITRPHDKNLHLPTIVFLGGFMSDMQGSKATFLESWALEKGYKYLRFDYTGHGESSGRFENGCIGDWARDAEYIINKLTQGPLILVGSSMGGWISLLLSRRIPERIQGFVGIAAAPDFTERTMWPSLSEIIQHRILSEGKAEVPSGYENPYVLTKKLFEDGRQNLVMNTPLVMPFPVRLLHGTEDDSVPIQTPADILSHIDCADARAVLIKGGDHSLSTPEMLNLIRTTIEELMV